jgi:histidinol dehydrogenase
VNEAKQQLHEAIRESATQTLSAEARPLIAALYAQLQGGERGAQEEGQGQPEDQTNMEQAKEKIVEQVREIGEAALGSSREQWNRELGESVKAARESMATQFGEIEQDRREGFEQQIASNIRQATETLERAANEVR